MLRRSLRPALLVGALALSVTLLGCTSARSGPGAASPGTIVATDLAFQPKELKVALNQPQTVRLDNKGKLLHDWTVEKIAVTAVKESGSASHGMDGQGGMGGAGMMPGVGNSPSGGPLALHVAAGPGRAAEIEFTATQPGTYAFFCTVPGHREAGMEGTLIVG